MEIKNQPVKNVSQEEGMVLSKRNYYLIILGVVIIVIGFILMSGGKYTDPNVFNGEELYSTRRITVAPIVVLLGFTIEIFAIFYKQKK
ncbi:MAG TPA: DUF3098 domain-containing protein [Chitinophagales bacterium]|nr:DUF3098 domain-containing protein [Chitinophagales bacterium]